MTYAYNGIHPLKSSADPLKFTLPVSAGNMMLQAIVLTALLVQVSESTTDTVCAIEMPLFQVFGGLISDHASLGKWKRASRLIEAAKREVATRKRSIDPDIDGEIL